MSVWRGGRMTHRDGGDGGGGGRISTPGRVGKISYKDGMSSPLDPEPPAAGCRVGGGREVKPRGTDHSQLRVSQADSEKLIL